MIEQRPVSHRLAPFLLFAGVAMLPAEGQSARTPQRLDITAAISAGEPSAATEDELSAILFRLDDEVVVSSSVDRGVSWSDPVRVDKDTTGSPKWVATDGGTPSIVIADGVIHVVWRDGRNGEDDLWYRHSLDGGSTWKKEVRLDKGYPVGTAPVREYALAVTQSGNSSHLHVLFTVDPGAGGSFLPDELYLTSSTNGGASWTNARSVSSANGSGADVDSFAIDAMGSDLVIAWSDDRFGSSTHDDLWLVRSLDAGVTFTGPEVQVDPSGPLSGDVENEIVLATEGNLLALAWEEELGSVREEAWVSVSTDRGASFVAGGRVGQYPPSSSDVDDVMLAIEDGVILVGWDDDRFGPDEVRVVRSTDLGTSWSDEHTLSETSGGDLRLVSGDGIVLATWSGDPIGGTGDRTRAAFSRDGGATWASPCDLSTNSSDVDDARPIWNAKYENLIVPWLADDTGTNGVWAGGFRPQALTPVGWTSGSQARVDFTGFSGTAPIAWAFGSTSMGSLPLGLGDGRDLGLLPDAVFQFTLQNPLLFSASLNATGSGSTASTLLPDAPGTVYYIAAVSLRLAPLGFDEVTDVVRVVVQ